MKWYKHDSNAHSNAKLERVLMKYGMEGYGLYWYCLELIAQTVEPHNLSFELEHDAEIISHRTGIHYERVQEMMTFMVGLDLFEQGQGTITCLKLARRADEYIGKIIRQLPEGQTNSGVTPDKNPSIRIEQNRTETKDKGQKAAPLTTSRFDDFWEQYPKKRKKKLARDIWRRKKLNPLADMIIEDVQLRLTKDERWKAGYACDPTTYLNQERWEDELTDSVAAPAPKPRKYVEPTAEELARDREKAVADLRRLGGKI